MSPALPTALVTTLPSYSLSSSSTAKRRSGGPGPGPSLWPPQPAHLSTHCQVWAQCDPPLPSLCQPAFLLTAQNPTSDPEDISEERWPLPSDRPYLQYPGRDEFFPGLLVLWPRRTLSPGLKLAPPEKLLPSLQTVMPRLWPSAEAPAPLQYTENLRTPEPLSGALGLRTRKQASVCESGNKAVAFLARAGSAGCQQSRASG